VWAIWLIAAVVLIFSDMHLQALYAVFLGIGAIAACIAAAVGGQLWLQGVLFAGVSGLGVGALRPPLGRWLLDRNDPLTVVPGTHGGFIGQHTETLDAVGDEQNPGHVELGHERWRAVTDVSGGIPAGIKVEVIALRGTTMLVRPIK
jgi:membrane protein implicated in regulation of membrane protease activity